MGLYLLIGNTLYRYVKEKTREINKINANTMEILKRTHWPYANRFDDAQ